ncbi:inner nuclear membrane protein Man1 [Cimex lectularius]|uniref:LEM domain-containing protein n=1 Tax=Cimex lectularius TaxID=79782 RepID=A0A8I6SJJ7_CIMLE|nr:inner nuclear membrane protein Man1 [Cimex lectularius]
MASVDVESLSDQEIRHKFKELGVAVGPVTQTTRKTLLKKLKTLLESEASFTDEPSVAEEPTRSRRKTLPPSRSPGRSPSRKSPSRASIAAPMANSTIAEPFPAAVNRTPSPPPPRPSRAEVRSNVPEVESYFNKIRQRPLFADREIADLRPSVNMQSTDFLSDYRSPTTSLFSPSLFSSSARTADLSPPASSNQPFTSDFMKRLSAGRVSQRSEPQLSPLSSVSKLDIKESDDEDSGPTPVYTKFSQGSFKGFDITHSKGSARVLSNDGWFSLDSPISAMLLFIFLAFFTFIGFTYVNMHFTDTSLALNTDLHFPPCLKVGNANPGENCIYEKDRDMTRSLLGIVYKEISEKLASMPCTSSQGPISFTDENIIQMILDKDKTLNVHLVEPNIKNLKVLVDHNPRFKIKATFDGFLLEQPPVTYYCMIVGSLLKAVNYTLKFLFVTAIGFIIYKMIKWWMKREARHKDEVYKLVSNIVDLVSSKCQSPEGYVAIDHIRDQLIAPQDRARKAKLWKDALTLLDTDSRIRREVQEVEGEEFMVWRWLASTSLSPNKRKMWQGQAFDTMEGSVNSLPHSPTACLKIRHMFDAEQEEGEDWVTTVVDAILEKCGKAKILHVVVDRQSRDGCVYMKCASTLDAGIAYRALHGSWFDSNLVTVKYLRERRYLERFPDSAKCTQPLRPSNDNKRSLQ